MVYHFALDKTPQIDKSTVCRLPPLDLHPGSSLSRLSDVFTTSRSGEPKSVHIASLPPLNKQSKSDIFQIYDTGAHNSSIEGMDGVAVGAATCLLASRKHPKPPNGMLNADQAVLSKAKALAEEAIKVGILVHFPILHFILMVNESV